MTLMWIRRSLIAMVATLLLAGPALAQKRLALVVGNNSYQHVSELQKAVNDARAVAGSLQRLGFTVILGENLTRRDFVQTLARLEAQVQPGDISFVFYAGHGVEIDGANYLLPVDVPNVGAGQQSLIKDEAISTDRLIQRLKARGARSQVLVLDACRDNPFRDQTGRSLGTARGLGTAQPSTGVFILYSAGIGEVALDRLSDNDSNANSVFTRTLVPMMERPDMSLVTLAKDVRAGVKSLAASVGHQQSPAYYDEIDGHLYLARHGSDTSLPEIRASLTPTPSVTPPPPAKFNGFIFSDSDGRLLSLEEVARLSRNDLRLARNEIFARKGRIFQSADLRDHFLRFPWYRSMYQDVPLNPIEQANVNLLLSMER